MQRQELRAMRGAPAIGYKAGASVNNLPTP